VTTFVLCYLDIEQIFMYSIGWGVYRISYIWIFWRRSRWHKKGLCNFWLS